MTVSGVFLFQTRSLPPWFRRHGNAFLGIAVKLVGDKRDVCIQASSVNDMEEEQEKEELLLMEGSISGLLTGHNSIRHFLFEAKRLVLLSHNTRRCEMMQRVETEVSTRNLFSDGR